MWINNCFRVVLFMGSEPMQKGVSQSVGSYMHGNWVTNAV